MMKESFQFSVFSFQKVANLVAVVLILSFLYVGSYVYLVSIHSIPTKGPVRIKSDGSFQYPRLVFVTPNPRASVLIQDLYLPLTTLDKTLTGAAPSFYANRFPVIRPEN